MMTSPQRVDLPVRYNFHSGAIGRIDCQRIGNGSLLSLGEMAAFGGATPEQTARAFLKRVGRKPNGESGDLLTDADVDAVSATELEEFADLTLAENEYLHRERVGREEGADGRPRTLYGDAFLTREDGESAVAFLARAVAKQPDRMANWASSISGVSGIGQSASVLSAMFPRASRLAGQAAAVRGGALASTVAALAEVAPLPERIAVAGPPPARRPADVTLEKLDERIEEFTKGLDADEQVALISISAPGAVSFFINERAAISKEMITLRGFDTDGKLIEVVQHYSQFNVALMAVPKVPTPRTYGFTPARS